VKILTNLDLGKNELQNARLQNLATAPTSPVAGQIYFNSADQRFYGWTGAAWVDLGQVLTGAVIVALINASASIIDDDNLSANVADAISKRHAHANMDTLNAIEEAFTTALKNKLDGIAVNANNYVHPNTAGNKHVPSGGSSGQVLKYGGSSGTASWGNLTSGEVTTALGYSPINDGGNTPEIGGGAESARPAATGSGMLYFAVDSGKIFKDTAAGTWTQMGGQDIPIASQTVLGLIKVGANLTIGPDGALNANDNPASFLIKQETFTVGPGQTTFNLIKGRYKPGAGAVFWYLYGQKQESVSLTEVSPTSVEINGLSEGDEILIEYIEIINASPYPVHASEHLTGGVDPIPVAMPTTDGLMAKADKSKLDGIAAGANNYVHPNHSGDVTSSSDGATTIGANKVTNTKLAKMGANTIKGNNTGASADPIDLTPAQVRTLINVADGANNYAHPTGAGNNHIPSGGAANHVLKYGGSSGAASWGALTAAEIPSLTLAKITDAGTAAAKTAGNAVGNVPIVGADGKLDTSIMPAIAISDTYVVGTQAAMLALTAQVGDIAVRADLSKSFILKAEPATTFANWQELLTPASPVQSVAGKTGTVTLASGDVGLGNVDNVQQATKVEFTTHDGDNTRHISAAERTSWNAKAGKYAAAIGNGSLTTITVTHGLNTMDVVVTVRDNAAPYEVVYPDVQIVDANNIKLLFGTAPTSDQYRVTVVG
jgi:hypothetical protein